ncbi:MAG: acyl--CoA ligase [Rhodobacteraceae bacterium]|nr:acyl--CoA ligase [Paracoccaceae bacterium]
MKPYLTLHDPAQTKRFYQSGAWKDDTFYSLMAGHARQTPDAVALRDGAVSLSWVQLQTRVDAMASDLRAQGLVAGDRVSLWMSNKSAAVITFLACAREGLACNPSLHRTHTCAEIVKLLTRLNTAALVTEPGWGADRADQGFTAMLGDLPFLKKTYTPETLPESPVTDLGNACSNPDSISYLAFTSGTTGPPKCVMHSDNTLLANARDLVADWGLGRDCVLLSLSPVSHHIAWVGVAQWLVCGGQYVLDDAPEGVSRLDWVLETGATYVMGVPTHAMDILAEQAARGLDRLGQVNQFYMAGAAIPEVVAEAFVAQGIRPQNVYGMTESSSHQYTHPDDDPQVWISTCGRGGAAYEVCIFNADDPDTPAAVGEIGQIGGRGPLLMLGYFGNQTATEDSFNSSGWFLSGDLGQFDSAGNLKIKGRLKDLIIRGGHNIYPSHIEALALRSDAIDYAAAFAVPDDRLGEKVCLAIMGSLSGDETLAHLQQAGLSKFDMPEYFITMEKFPLTASGKILKRELETQLANGSLVPKAIRFNAKME